MLTRKTWIVFLSTAGILATLFSLFLLYSSRENEKKLRVRKEVELSQKLVELSDKQAEISNLAKQKAEIEEQFGTRVSALESTLRESEEKSRAVAAKVEDLTRENDQLKTEVAEKEKRLTDLARRIRQLETEKEELLASIQRAEAEGGGPKKEGPSAVSDGLTPRHDVKLGKIVVQKASGSAARVQYVDRVYGFVVIGAGTRDGLASNSIVNILRNDRFVGKAVIRKARPDISAAVLLPEWAQDEIRIGDIVSRF